MGGGRGGGGGGHQERRQGGGGGVGRHQGDEPKFLHPPWLTVLGALSEWRCRTSSVGVSGRRAVRAVPPTGHGPGRG